VPAAVAARDDRAARDAPRDDRAAREAPRDDRAAREPARPRPRPLRDGAATPRDRAAPPPRDGAAAATATGGAPRSSRVGGAILIAILVLAVAGLIVFVLARGGDDSPSAGSQESPAASATPTPAVTATGNDIVLQGTKGSKAVGLMRLLPGSKGTVQFAIAAQNVPANQGREVYAVWFTGDKLQPRRLGFAQAQVGQDGVLTTAGPQKRDEKAFPRWFATYQKVLITRETAARATRPGPAVLEGTLPSGA